MSLPYVPADIIEEARDRRRQGDSLQVLASRIGINPEDLATLLGEPAWKQTPDGEPAADDCDLWAADNLNEVL
ncbi:MAG: hypothetical protein ACK526_23350 [Planctomyces sp.]|jgi:hypothetical protein